MVSISSLFPLCFLLSTTLLSSTSEQPLFLPLTHTLSQTQHTQHQLLTTAALRHRHRHRRRHQRNRSFQISLPLSSGSDYTLSFSLGTPSSQNVNLYMDTGSDLVWLPCAPFECILCDGKPSPTPLSTNLSSASTPVPCTSRSCSAAHSSLPTSDVCAISGCSLESIETDPSSCSSFSCPPFYYAYGDGSLIAHLRHDRLSIPVGSVNPIRIPKFTFGCAHTTLAEPIGVAGFGRGLLSLPAQLSQLSPHLGNQFSYCLVSHNFESTRIIRPSPLILGRSSIAGSKSDSIIYTPMLDNPKKNYYYLVGLEGVSVGGKRIVADGRLSNVDRDGNGGFVVDSGTTFTMLPTYLYEKVRSEFHVRMKRVGFERASEVEEETGLGPCYYNASWLVPSLGLHFGGNATVMLPRRNYYVGFKRGERETGCFMVMDGGDDSASGPAGTLGNIQQQGFEVVYDLEGRRVGFARRRCASLWDTAPRG